MLRKKTGGPKVDSLVKMTEDLSSVRIPYNPYKYELSLKAWPTLSTQCKA